jgi:hypothetical protein
MLHLWAEAERHGGGLPGQVVARYTPGPAAVTSKAADGRTWFPRMGGRVGARSGVSRRSDVPGLAIVLVDSSTTPDAMDRPARAVRGGAQTAVGAISTAPSGRRGAARRSSGRA